MIKLRPTETADLNLLFQFQLNEEANYLAAFMPVDHTNEKAYLEKYTRFLKDPTIHMFTILINERIGGSIAKFERDGVAEITYWIDRQLWGQGIATVALLQFLTLEQARPLFARIAFDNIGSQKVLEKNGFLKIGTDKGFANARQQEIEEYIYRLI